MKTDWNIVKQWINEPQKVVITPHRKPDGDAIGSALGMYHFLKAKGHDAIVVAPTEYAEFLHFLPEDDQVLIYTEEQAKADELIKAATLIFILDYNDLKRIDDMAPAVERASAKRIMIDHHPYPVTPVDFQFLVTEASSTAELVYDFIQNIGESAYLSAAVAECLYAGISSDTGRFKFSITSKVHTTVADLISKGIDATAINGALFDSFSERRLRFTGYCLTERLKVINEYHTAIIYVTAKDMRRFYYQTGDTEGLVNFALSITGMRFAVLLVEQKDLTKMSLRSKGDFAVNKIAQQYFNGGGHRNAAGGTIEMSLKKTMTKIINLLPNYADELK